MSAGPYHVMVWIYGGGYQDGATIQYPGDFLATKDVIVVAPNYRLGNLGKYCRFTVNSLYLASIIFSVFTPKVY